MILLSEIIGFGSILYWKVNGVIIKFICLYLTKRDEEICIRALSAN